MSSFLRNCTRPLYRFCSHCPLLQYAWKGAARKIRRYVHVRGGPRRRGSASRRASAPPRWQEQGVKMSRCQDVKMSKTLQLALSRCQDAKMSSRCQDVKHAVLGSQDVKMPRCQDVKMSSRCQVRACGVSRCQDVRRATFICQDVKMSRCQIFNKYLKFKFKFKLKSLLSVAI